ncbi:hypothetical protein Q5O14_17765 [Eubacteriaceae bacterium ES2]|nr:hypothetical protein Q5O14_17765 [Eubacteriaceae bacterium ES2]
MVKKIGKYFPVLIIIAAIFYFIKTNTLNDIWNSIVEINLMISNEKAVLLFLIYWVEITVILIFLDILIFFFSVEINCFAEEAAENFLKKGRIRSSILCIRLNYGIKKLMFFLKPKLIIISNSSDNNNTVWNSITKGTTKDFILSIVFSLIKLPALFSMLLTFISLKYFDLNSIQEIWNRFSSSNFDFWEYVKLISPLITVILVIFIGYFTSFRGNIKRSISQANRKKMEVIIEEQRELVEAIGDSLYSIASNLQYVINCQDLVADIWIHGKYPNYNDEKCKLWNNYKDYSNHFEDIGELKTISQKFAELTSNGNGDTFRVFSRYNYDLLSLVADSSRLDIERLNREFFTKEGIKTLIPDPEDFMSEYTEEKERIQKERDNYISMLPGTIVDSLELLYKFCRYYVKMNKLLNINSDKMGRTLRMLTGKE